MDPARIMARADRMLRVRGIAAAALSPGKLPDLDVGLWVGSQAIWPMFLALPPSGGAHASAAGTDGAASRRAVA